MSFQQLVYISRAAMPLDCPLDLTEILEQAVRNNPRLQITGALAYSSGWFVQVLEGPATSLDMLLPVLEADPRHCGVDILDRVTVRERAFPEWAMLFPVFTPGTAAELTQALAQGRRHMPFYRDLLSRMAREQTISLLAQPMPQDW